MLSSKQRVAATSRKKRLEDEKSAKEKKKASKDEEEKMKKQTKVKPSGGQTKRPPLTPPSSRVTKTQFFSSKTTPQRHSDTKSTASSTKSGTKPKLKEPPRVSTKSERPSVKEFIKKAREESKKKPEIKRPGTATLKNPVILKNIADPSPTTTATNDDIDYEDDFDSYESDFEQEPSSISDTSTSSDSSSLIVAATTDEKRINSADEEKKLDSGTFDLPEAKHRQVLHNITETIESEKCTASLTDEGFEDVKSPAGDSGCFINFTSAQKKLKQSRIDAKQRKRGEEIFSMIKLDSFTFTLFDLAPMSYEKYIKLYGQQNCLQASVQTGDDNVDEECQTDEVIKCDKWTQAPIKFSKFDCLEVYKQEFKGVGCDKGINENATENHPSILSAAQLLLNLLQENNNHSLKELQNSDLASFSSGYVECNTETIPLLKNTFVTYIAYNTSDSSLFLTAHRQKDGSECKSFLCTWYLSNLNQPESIFVSYSEVTCCCFSRSDTKLVCAGSIDGSVSVWNNKQNFMDTKQQVPDCISEIGLGHISKIISIQSVSNLSDDESGNQLCTLDCDGLLIFWTVHHFKENLILTQNNKIALKTNNQTVNALLINHLDPNHLFVGTAAGYVIHTLITNTKTHPKKFSAPSEVACMAACPFSELYFLAGFYNGCVALYSRLTEKPLIVMVSKNLESRVEQIEWSCSRPCVFYVKHENVVDVWDLMYSDMVPVCSVPFKKQLECIKEMPTKENYRNLKKSCMIVAYASGELQLHILNKEHGQNSIESFKKDVKKFLNYVNRL